MRGLIVGPAGQAPAGSLREEGGTGLEKAPCRRGQFRIAPNECMAGQGAAAVGEASPAGQERE